MKNKFTEVEMELSVAIKDAYSALTGLGEEMQEAYDNTPENIQSSALGEAREMAADQLGALEEPTIHESIEATKVKVHLPVRTPAQERRTSRSDRRDDAISMLQSCVDVLQDMNEYAHVEPLLEELEQLISEAEGVEFPGRNV